MLLKNKGEVKAVMGCGQYNLVIEVGETKDIPEPMVTAFQLRFPALVNVTDGDQSEVPDYIEEKPDMPKPKRKYTRKEA